MIRKLFIYFLLACVLVWLILSYSPSLQQWLPVIAFSESWHPGLMWLGALAGLLFLAIQSWLVVSTARSLRRRRLLNETQQSGLEARLNLPAEIIWTALPIAMTALLFAAAYQIWVAR